MNEIVKERWYLSTCYRRIWSLSVLCAILVAPFYLSGCHSVHLPATGPEYAPPLPLLERGERPVPRVRTEEPDVRVISEYRPTGEERPGRSGFAHPSGAMGVKEIFFQDVPLEIAAELLNEVGGVNLMLQGPVAGKRVRLFLRDVTMATAVEALLRGNELWFRTEDGVTVVMSEQAFADSMVFQQSEKIQAFFMRYTNAQDMAALLATLLGPDVELRDMAGQAAYGHLEAQAVGAGSSAPTQREALTDDERRLLVKLGEAETIQEIEEATGALGRRLPAVIAVFKRNNSIVVRSTDEGLLRHITGLIRELDTPVNQVLLEVRIIRLQLGDGFESFLDISWENIGNRTLSLSTLGGAGSLASDTFAAAFSRGGIEARLQLFAGKDRLKTISSPFLMTADNAEVRFFVGEQVPLRTGVRKETVRTGDLQDLVFFLPLVEEREIGTELQIKSFINADRTITMEIVATIETPNIAVSSIPLVNERTGQVVNYPLDGVDKNELRSILAVPTGDTVALGGFIRLEDQDFEQKVPLLGDIPVLGYLFKKVERAASRSETVILITPHVLGHPAEGVEASERLLDKSSRVLEEIAPERRIPGGEKPGSTEDDERRLEQ